ncbi:ArsR family transcriptional regulator [Aeromonas jandaei]|uniref:VpaChn25_0724 family phage protein n=1 Tax=Aeromonas jandaei TaxID=650 RepID=UPI003BA397B6
MSGKEFVLEDQRLIILRELKDQNGYETNDSILDVVLESWGHCISRDAVRTQICWLEEQNLVTTRAMGDYLIAKLTSRGFDVAKGDATVPGVKKPRPE